MESALTLYSRNHCHLRGEMITGLRALQTGFHFNLDIVDVDGDAELERRFGELVPVLVHDGRELCRYHLDTAVITALLPEIR